MRVRLFAAGAGLCLLMSGAVTAHAQSYGNPDLPRSPYALPEPTYRGGDDQESQEQPHPWRHWGDSRNNGELVYGLVAPDGVLGSGALGGGRYGAPVAPPPDSRAHARFCRRHPGACD